MITLPANLLTQKGDDPQPLAVKQLKTYLKDRQVEYTLEDGDNPLFRLPICPIKGRACDDRSYIIVSTDGSIHAGCHGGKCADKGWADFQAAWGKTLAEFAGAPKGKKPRSDPSAQIVNAAIESDKFFHDENGNGYLETVRRSAPEVLRVRESAYRNILRLRFTQNTGQIAKREWLNNAIEQLDAHAIESADEHQVFVRVGHHGGKIYIDLGDKARTIIEVTPNGWQPIKDCPVYFRRPKSMRPLPTPQHGGSLEMLRQLVNIAKDDLALYAAFLVMVFHPRGPYPIAALIGGSGHAKSCTARYTRQFVDPSNVSGSAQSKDNEDLMIAARDKRLLTFDNLNSINQQQSDDLCRLATGASHSRRTKFTDCDETTFVAKNPVLITSIKDVLSAADLLDRSLRFVLPKLVAVKSETLHDADVESAAPKILGWLLNGVASALRNLPATTIADPPRMIEFALWGTAAENGLGLNAGDVMKAYRKNIGEVNQIALESDLAQSIVKLRQFNGKLKELATKLGWGTTAKECKELAGQLRVLASPLAKIGILVDLDLPLIDGCKAVSISTQAQP
jgi:hypothetical protein